MQVVMPLEALLPSISYPTRHQQPQPLLHDSLSSAASLESLETLDTASTADASITTAAAAHEAAAVAAAASEAAARDRTQYLPPAFVPREGEVGRLAGEVGAIRARLREHNLAVAAGQLPPPTALEVEMAITIAV